VVIDTAEIAEVVAQHSRCGWSSDPDGGIIMACGETSPGLYPSVARVSFIQAHIAEMVTAYIKDHVRSQGPLTREDIARGMALTDGLINPPMGGKYGRYADIVMGMIDEASLADEPTVAERVLALHTPVKASDPRYGDWCRECYEAGGEDATNLWPCKTVRAVDPSMKDPNA
jgi:hypothetical protein